MIFASHAFDGMKIKIARFLNRVVVGYVSAIAGFSIHFQRVAFVCHVPRFDPGPALTMIST